MKLQLCASQIINILSCANSEIDSSPRDLYIMTLRPFLYQSILTIKFTGTFYGAFFKNKSYATGTKMWDTTKMRKACSFLIIFLWANCQAFDRSAVEKQHSTV